MADDALRDTVPAPPVPSTNPTADLRKALEAERAAARYALYGGDTGILFVGLEITDGRAMRITPMLDHETAKEWLRRARAAAAEGAWIPTICKKRHVRDTPALCGKCMRRK